MKKNNVKGQTVHDLIYVNQYPVHINKFGGGEINVRLNDKTKGSQFNVCAHLVSSDAIIALILTVDAIRRKFGYRVGIFLCLPYLPFARQDRVCHGGEAFSLFSIINIIFALKVRGISLFDIHNEMSTFNLCHKYLMKRREDFLNYSALHNIIERTKLKDSKNIVSPDDGSLKKITWLDGEPNIIKCRKERTENGVFSTEIVGEVENKDLLIMDDICDGGRTFVALAKELKNRGAKKIELYVTHGIFSNGFDELSKYIDKFYCTFPFPGIHNEKLEILKDIESGRTFVDLYLRGLQLETR